MQNVENVATFQNLPTIITLLIVLSVAAERFVEIVKGFSHRLSERKTDPRLEARRKASLHTLAIVGGIGVTLLAWDVVVVVVGGTPTRSENVLTILALGLLASGGSGFWNTILTHVTNIKEMKRASLQALERDGSSMRALPQPGEGVLSP